MAESFKIRSLDDPGADGAVLVIQGGIDADCSQDLRMRVLALSEAGESTVTLILRDVDLLASTGVGTLLLLTETLRAKGQRLILQELSTSVEQVIGLLNLESFLDIVQPASAG